MTAILPQLEHFRFEDYEHFYEPSDDTFLLCDALLHDIKLLTTLNPNICIEFGSGSGCVITYLSSLLSSSCVGPSVFMAVEVNPRAAVATKLTATVNSQHVDVICADFTTCPLTPHSVDLLVFNPPYVPTPDEEVGGTGVSASWAGGTDGRVVIDRFIELLSGFLGARGLCYLLLVQENRPNDVIRQLGARGFLATQVLRRRARNEDLQVLRIERLHVQEDHLSCPDPLAQLS